MLKLLLKTMTQFFAIPAAVLSLTWWGYAIAEVQPDRSITEWTLIGIGALVIGELIAFRVKSSSSLATVLGVCTLVVVGLPWYVIANDPTVVSSMRAHQFDYGGAVLALLGLAIAAIPLRWIANGYSVLDVMERTGNLPRGSLGRALKRAAGDE